MNSAETERGWAFALVAAAAAAAFLGAAVADFTWDDPTHVLANPAIFAFRPFHFFSVSYWDREFAYPGLYRPFHALSLALDYALWKDNPLGYHLTNIALHAFACMAVAHLVWTYSGRARVGVIAGLLFAAAPCHVETVAWVKNRSVLLATAFGALSAAAFWRAARSDAAVRSYAGALAAYLCALASHPISVVFPAGLLALALAGLPRPGWRRAAARSAPFFAASAAFLLFRHAAFTRGEFAGVPRAASIPLAQHARVVADTAWFYLRALASLAPAGPIHSFPLQRPMTPAAWARIAGAGAAGAALLWIAWRTRRLGWALLFGLGMGPILNFSIIAGRPLAEQRLYWPSLGLYAWLADACVRRRGPRAALAAALVIPMAALCIQRVGYWRDAAVFWSRAARVAPDSPRAQEWRGVSVKEQGRLRLAQKHLLRAVELNPQLASAWETLGRIWLAQGRTDKAEAAFRKAVELRPDESPFHNGLGVFYARQGRWDAALECFERAVKCWPLNAVAATNLAKAAARAAAARAAEGELDAALACCRRGEAKAAANPAKAALEKTWAQILLRQGRVRDALEHIERGLRAVPADADLIRLKTDALNRAQDSPAKPRGQ